MYQQRNLERTHIRAYLRRVFMDMTKRVFVVAEERAAERAKQAAAQALTLEKAKSQEMPTSKKSSDK